MTTPDRGPDRVRGVPLEEHLRALIASARPEQIARLLRDVEATGGDGFPPVRGTA